MLRLLMRRLLCVSIATYAAASRSAWADLSYKLMDLGSLDGGITEPSAINNRGEVAGSSIVTEAGGQQFYHPFRSGPNQPLKRTDDLVYPRSPGFEVAARSINASGQVAAVALGAGSFIAARYRTGPDAPLDFTADDLGVSGGSTNFVGIGIAVNDAGQVAGSGNGFAFRTQPQQKYNPATDNLGSLVPGTNNSCPSNKT